MREHKLHSLLPICLDIADYALKDNVLNIQVHNKIDYDSLTKEQNYSNLVETFAQIGYNLNINVLYLPTKVIQPKNNIDELSEKIGIKVQVK